MSNIIASISTAQGVGGIAIIRLSGSDIVNAINHLFKYDLVGQKHGTISYNHFLIDDNYFDEVLVTVFNRPHSFTGEDVVEINCHGGIYVTNEILKQLIKQEDISLAKPGEFSKRAFLNGKKTLDEMNATNDIINAENKLMHDVALNSLKGETKKLINELREDLLAVIAQIEVNIDYPEYEDIEVFTTEYVGKHIEKYISKSKIIVADSNRGQLIKSGIDTAIIGSPNVGKSTLLNMLSREDKAIVTSIEGTTRDVVENSINLGSIKLNLFDTAGIRKTIDEVEQLGIDKSLKMIDQATLILFVIDGSRELTQAELNLYNKEIKYKNHLVLINKSDLKSVIDESQFTDAIKLSALEKTNIELLEHKILSNLDLLDFDINSSKILSNIQDVAKLEQALSLLLEVQIKIENKELIDLIEMDLREVLFMYDEILQINSKENLIDELFSRFCLGK